MSSKLGDTKLYTSPAADLNSPENIIREVYQALKAKGYDPITQLVGYILSGDPTYITSYNQARSLIRRLERDEIIEELVSHYVAHKLEKDLR